MRMWVVFFLFFCGFQSSAFADMVAESCDCPKLECDPCHQQKGVSFYSEKCGGGDRVRSCAKPTCIALEPQPANCANLAKKEEAPAAKPADREIASVDAAPAKQKVVGTLAIVKGSVTIKDPSGKIVQLKEGSPIHEKDEIETSSSGQTQVKFNDGNIVHVREGSQVKIDQYDVEDSPDKKAVLDLLKGKIRNQVMKKYDGKQSKYEIRTRAAVAGVRGTDFIVSWMDGEKDVTRIDAFSGEVRLMDRFDEKEEVTVKKNQSVSFVVDGPAEALEGEDAKEFAQKGHFTELAELSEMEVAKLDIATRVGDEPAVTRSTVSTPPAGKGICNSPKAPFNSCLWKCMNNPKGSSTCRTDLPQVTCIRARCNANGDWAEETRLPASFHGMCPPQEATVAPCDY